MKLLKLGMAFILIILAAIAVLVNFNHIGNNDISGNKVAFDSMNMFKEEKCIEDSGEEICTETLYMQNDGGNKIPLMTGHTIKETIFVPKYIEKEKIIIEEKKLMGEEKPSPSDRIEDSDVTTFSNNVRIDISNAKWRKYIDSNSMDPLIDEGTTTIEIKPKNANEIKIGDILHMIWKAMSMLLCTEL